MIYIVLALIFFLFLVIALLNISIEKIFRKKICAICAAVSLTWMALLLAKFFGYAVDDIIIAILMGESITGIMYLFEDYANRKNKKLIILKVLIILLGTLIVYGVLRWI